MNDTAVLLLTIGSFLGLFIFLAAIFWVIYTRNRQKQLDAGQALKLKATELVADEEDRLRRKEQEQQLLAMGTLDMMVMYLQRIGASTQMAAWVRSFQSDVATSETASMRLFYHPMDTIVDPIRRATVNGKSIERERPAADVRKEYADKVAKGVLRAISESFSNLPTLQHMVVTGYVPVGGEQGHICAVSARVSRDTFQMVRDLQKGPALEILSQFELNIDCQPNTWELGEVPPFELPLGGMRSNPRLPAAPPQVVPVEPAAPVPAAPAPAEPAPVADPAQQRFEEAVAQVLEQGGLRVLERTKAPDGSVQIVATSVKTGTGTILVRARRTREPIEADELTAFADMSASQQPDKLFFLTTSTFELDAIKVAGERKIELLDGAKLNMIWKKIQSGAGGQKS